MADGVTVSDASIGESEEWVYVEFDGGNRNPGGYVVPARLTGRRSGRQSYVLLSSSTLNPTVRYVWGVWIRDKYILTDDEVAELLG